MTQQYTFKQLQNGLCSPSDYYRQFVSKKLKETLSDRLTAYRLSTSLRQDFKDIGTAFDWFYVHNNIGPIIQDWSLRSDLPYNPQSAEAVMIETAKELVQDWKESLKNNSQKPLTSCSMCAIISHQ